MDSAASNGHIKIDESRTELLPLYNDAKHEKLAASISAYLDARYRYGGNDSNAIDCSGFVKAVFQEVYDINLPRKSAEIYRLGTKIGKGSLETADLVFFSTAGWRSINHVGIYLSDNKFVHSSTSQGVTISRLDEEYWKRRYRGARRL
jgi:cell wall-associated NlpC family hydrolase